MSSHNETVDDETFVRLFESIGPSALARRIGCTMRPVYGRRARLEKKLRRKLIAPKDTRLLMREGPEHPVRQHLHIKDGEVLVASDAHFWPGERSTAFRAFVQFCRDRKQRLRAVIMNGDELDGATISRHAPIGWEKRPSLIEEIDACKDRLGEIEKVIGGACPLIWSLGNHDARFATRLAHVAPEYARVHGTQLKDHFPFWRPCWSVWINNDVVIKHRFKGGTHATRNNALNSGKTMVTGHLHSLKVTPLTDYSGTRYGVDTGTLLEPGFEGSWGSQVVNYLEDSPVDWRAGFALLTFKDGRLLWPEVIHAFAPGKVEFRGEVYDV